jgi:PAS domain-containing protein
MTFRMLTRTMEGGRPPLRLRLPIGVTAMAERELISLVVDDAERVAPLIATIRSLDLDAELCVVETSLIEHGQLGRLVLLPCTAIEDHFALMRRVRGLHSRHAIVSVVPKLSRELVTCLSSEGAFDLIGLDDDAPIVERVLLRALARRPRLLAAEPGMDSKLRSLVDRLLESQAIASVGSFELDVRTGELERTPEFCRIMGVEPNEPALSLRSYLERVHSEDRRRVENEMKATFEQGKPLESRHRLVHGNGNVVSVHARGNVDRAPDGSPLRAVGVVQDVSEVERLQSQLGAFVQSVAHDLRSPLTVMVGFASLIEEEAEADGRTRIVRHAENIISQGRRLQRLIAAFLDLSRSTHAAIERSHVNFSELAESAYQRLHAAVRPSREPTFVLQPALVTRADPVLLDILISNLIENALKYTAALEAPRIEVGTTQDNGRDAFFVADNGIGFDPALAPRLFVPFTRLHAAREFEGDGLGLATCERIVKRHGGSIWVRTQPNHGTTFFFTLSPD